LPFKAQADRRHHIPKQRHRVTNWAAYDAGLRARGSLTVWFTAEAIQAWRAERRIGRGGQPCHSSPAITAALALPAVFRLAPRRIEGPIASVLRLLGLDLAVPDRTTLSRRAGTLEENYGTGRRRTWKRLHPARDADAGHIVASALTDRGTGDGSRVGPLPDQVDGPVESPTADGAFGRDGVYAAVAARHPDATVIVPPRSSAVPSATAETAPTRRDAHLRCIAERGRMGWQRASGYNRRALVEADVSRWKRVIGDGLRSQTDGRQATEVAIAADVLNRMLDLGRPEYVRIA
jgi:hypothetical protein